MAILLLDSSVDEVRLPRANVRLCVTCTDNIEHDHGDPFSREFEILISKKQQTMKLVTQKADCKLKCRLKNQGR
jgi:hypothetical protein